MRSGLAFALAARWRLAKRTLRQADKYSARTVLKRSLTVSHSREIVDNQCYSNHMDMHDLAEALMMGVGVLTTVLVLRRLVTGR